MQLQIPDLLSVRPLLRRDWRAMKFESATNMLVVTRSARPNGAALG